MTLSAAAGLRLGSDKIAILDRVTLTKGPITIPLRKLVKNGEIGCARVKIKLILQEFEN